MNKDPLDPEIHVEVQAMSTELLCIRCLQKPPTEGNLCGPCAKPAQLTSTEGLCLLCVTPIAPEHYCCDAHVEDEGHIVIEDAASDFVRFLDLGIGLKVTVKINGKNIIVRGAGLDDYLARLDPGVWDPANAQRGA